MPFSFSRETIGQKFKYQSIVNRMKKLKQFLVLFFVFWSGITFADGYKVLYLGNSYVYTNDLPLQVAKMAESTGDNLIYESNSPGGCFFSGHTQNGTSISLIQQGEWDYVVLQGQSQEPSFPDVQFYSQTYPYAQQLCQMVSTYNPRSHAVFFMTWGRKDGDASNCLNFPPLCTYEGMDSLLYLRYMIMGEDFGAWVSPVGALWHYLRDNYPEINLYSSDGSHPNEYGTYVAACCFYTIFFQKNPTAITYNSNLSSEQAQIIKDAAKTVVYDNLSLWVNPHVSTSIADYESKNEFSVLIQPNPVGEELSIVSDNSISEIVIYSIDGKEIYRKIIGSNEEIINVSNLKSAIYIISISDKQQNMVYRKFFKK